MLVSEFLVSEEGELLEQMVCINPDLTMSTGKITDALGDTE